MAPFVSTNMKDILPRARTATSDRALNLGLTRLTCSMSQSAWHNIRKHVKADCIDPTSADTSPSFGPLKECRQSERGKEDRREEGNMKDEDD